VSDQQLHQLYPTPIERERKARQLTALLNIGALVLALCWLALIAVTLTTDNDDFKQYWQASVNVFQSGDPYATTPEPGAAPSISSRALTIFYPYPPLLAYLIQPLALLEHGMAQRVWFGINCLALLALIWLCIDLSGSALARRYWGVVALGALLVPPTRLSLQLGQVSIVLALMIVGVFAFTRRYPSISGGLLALTTLIKLYPGFLALFYVSRHSYRVVVWAIVTGVLMFTLSVLAYGVAPYQSYLHKDLLSGSYPYAAEFNISLVGFWDRLLSASNYAQPLAIWPGLARVIAAALSIGVVGVCLKAGRDAPDETTLLLQHGAWLCGMLLLSPINGYYNLVLLLLPLLAALHYLERRPNRRAACWLIVATALVCIPPGWTQAQPAIYDALHRGIGLLLLTPAIYGLVIYLGLLALLAYRSTAKGRVVRSTHGDR
jgi:hypothetical protein